MYIVTIKARKDEIYKIENTIKTICIFLLNQLNNIKTNNICSYFMVKTYIIITPNEYIINSFRIYIVQHFYSVILVA